MNRVRLVKGRYQNLRRAVSAPLLLAFFVFPWLSWEGSPWLRFVFEQRRIYVFGQALLWQDLPLLAALLILAAFALFFVAVLWGRVWCGFACPQTIWTWMFIRIEEIANRLARRLHKSGGRSSALAPTAESATKHLLWSLLAFWTAFTFTAYFVSPANLLEQAIAGSLPAFTWAWTAGMAALVYINAGYLRERFCTHVCPYSRFQSVMFDDHTRSVAYDSQRGEKRASLRSNTPGAGDCIDCTLCVQVCPTRIDIRDGLSSACIDCGACIDACDSVMTGIERPTGLIRFESNRGLAGSPRRSLTPKAVAYGIVTALAFAVVIAGISSTSTMVLEVRRDRDSLYTYSSDYATCNSYQMKVESASFNAEDIHVRVSPSTFTFEGPDVLRLIDTDTGWVGFKVCGDPQGVYSTPLLITVSNSHSDATRQTTFLSGSKLAMR